MSNTSDDLLNQAAESFLARVRGGETPSIMEYADRYPELADQIHDLFPTLAAVERVGNREATGPCHGDSAVPEQLGDYILVRQIARGGMGIVYEAYQSSLGRRVALKMLAGHLQQDQKALLRFRREARSAAQLHHTNIVPVYDVGQHEGVHYYSMQFIEGQSLDRIWSELRRIRSSGPIESAHNPASVLADSLLTGFPSGMRNNHPPSSHGSGHHECAEASDQSTEMNVGDYMEKTRRRNDRWSTQQTGDDATNSSSEVHLLLDAYSSGSATTDRQYFRNIAAVAVQVLDAVAYAHQRGVLHRDVKPSNIILDTQGRAWVTDFGLATTNGTEALTETGDIVGTIRYMSAERFTGRADQRSDIYSIGLTIHEFLTLRPAFEELNKTRLIDCIQNSSVPPPSQLEPNVPHDLETIVLKATERTPERRYQTAEAFAEDLRHFLAGRPIVARRTTWTEQGWLWCRRNPIVASLATAIAMLLVAITLVATVAAFAAREYADDLATEKARVEAAELQARRRLFDSYVNEARAVHWSGRPGRRFDSLAAIGKAAKLLPTLKLPAELSREKKLLMRNHAIAGLSLSDLQLREAWTTEGRMTAFAFDANVERFARGDMQGNISIHRVATNEPQLFLPGFELPVWGITFSRDGKHLAARYENYSPAVLKVWNLESKSVLFEVDPVVNKPAVDFAPHGDQVAIARHGGTVEIHELPSGRIVARLPEETSANHLQFSPDGTRLAITSYARHNESFGVAVWDLITRQREKLLTPSGTHRIAWSHDGKSLAVADDAGFAYVWNVENKQPLLTLGPYDQPLIQVSFNATDQLLAMCTWRRTFLCDAATGEEQLSADGRCEHFSVNDLWLAFRQGSQLGRWKVNVGSERRVVRVDEPLRGLNATKQGWGLLAAAGVGGIDVLDARRGRKLAHLPGLSLAAIFNPGCHELITSGELGIFRWPMQYSSDDNASNLHLGPPRKLLEPTGSGATGLTGRVDHDGDKQLVIASKNRARIIELQRETITSTTGEQENLHYVALSPNGQWLASGTWNGRGVKVWATDSGRLWADLLSDCSHARVFFSPDGRLLVVGIGGKLCFFEVPTWRLARELPRQDAGTFPGAAAFTHDGNVVAFAVSPRRLQLVETGTWRVVSELELSGGNVESLCFTDADRRLAAATTGGIVIWDIQGIRRQLQQFELDWGSTSESIVEPLQAHADPVNMVVELGSYGAEYESIVADNLATEHARAGDWEAAIKSLERAITIHPRNASAQNSLAWLLSTCPDDALRNPVRAVEHAEKAVQISPDAAAHWNTLGTALYRSNQWLAAIEALEHSQSIDPVTYLGHNGYILTMAFWKIGKPDTAQTWFNQATGAVGYDDTTTEELRRLAEEVKDLCGFAVDQ